MTFGVVLLAAGSSSRLGRPKQLLPYGGTTLVAHAAQIALDSGAAEVVAVLGASADEVRSALGDLPARTVVNEAYEEGMGSSIRVGVREIAERRPVIEALVVMLVDQPQITAEHLRALIAKLDPPDPPLSTLHPPSIVASSYDGVLGAPCAFGRSEFPALLALRGDVGARSWVRGESVAVVPFAGGRFDVDTPDDAARLG